MSSKIELILLSPFGWQGSEISTIGYWLISYVTLHKQNVIYSLGASRSVCEDVECKLRCVNFRRVSDHRRAFRPAFRVTGIADNWHRSTMGVVAISLKSPGSAGEKSCNANYKPGSTSDNSGSASDMPGSTSNHCKPVWEKWHLWERCRCAWKSQLQLIIQRFLKLMYSVCILIYVSL